MRLSVNHQYFLGPSCPVSEILQVSEKIDPTPRGVPFVLGDMIETYKILHGFYDCTVSPT